MQMVVSWLPMETAPKDGSFVIAWNGHDPMLCCYREGHFMVDATIISENGGHMDWVFPWPELTHWFPLPPLPSVHGE
jgi:hypothetical protein